MTKSAHNPPATGTTPGAVWVRPEAMSPTGAVASVLWQMHTSGRLSQTALSHISQKLFGRPVSEMKPPDRSAAEHQGNPSRDTITQAHEPASPPRKYGTGHPIPPGQSVSPGYKVLQVFYVTEGQGAVYEAIAYSGDDTVSRRPRLSVGQWPDCSPTCSMAQPTHSAAAAAM